MSIRKVKATLRRHRTRHNPAIPLPFPVPSTLRVAQLSPGPRFADVRAFVAKRWADLGAFAPNVMIGSLGEMQSLADLAIAGTVDASSVDHALVILTRYGGRPLNDVARVTLWQSFGVPVFELYLGLDDSLLASECEAHEGWHLAAGISYVILDTGELVLDGAGNAGLRTGLTATLDQKTCPCSRPLPRVLNVEPLRRRGGRYLAASA